MSSDIKCLHGVGGAGIQRIVYLGSGTSFDVIEAAKSIGLDQAKLTVNDFIVELDDSESSSWSRLQNGDLTPSASASISLSKSYDQSRGVLTAYQRYEFETHYTGSGYADQGSSEKRNLSVKAYLVKGLK